MPETVVTRFAPSPTGFLHIGNARTALFNWLYARHCGGTFRLRIEDTDRARSTEPAIQAIFDGLTWLGLDWDDDPVLQFARSEHHAASVDRLLELGHAYRCYLSPEEVETLRNEARTAGRRLESPWRDQDPATAPQDRQPVVRFRAPRNGETVIEDRVQGTVRIANTQLDDMVLLRSDGTPTYMLAVVIDDHDMAVTHVLRGDDHLVNAARQMQLYHAFGWEPPVFAHIPLLHGPDGAKLSKRHGALGVDAYRDMGYLPAAMRNYLARLGWSHGDDEIFSTDQAIAWFDLDGINKSAARLDFAKLDSVNAHYLRAVSVDDAVAAMEALALAKPALADRPNRERLETAMSHAPLADWQRARLTAAMEALRERAKTLLDLWDSVGYLLHDGAPEIEPDASTLLSDDARALIEALIPDLSSVEPWSPDSLDATVKAFLTARALKFGKVGPALRAALTGRKTSPSVIIVMHALGQAETIARLQAATNAAPAQM